MRCCHLFSHVRCLKKDAGQLSFEHRDTQDLQPCGFHWDPREHKRSSSHHFFVEEVSKKENTVDFGLFFVFIIIGEVFTDF